MRAKFVRVCSLAAVLLIAVALPAQTSDFTIIALPDTQNESQFFPAALSAQTQWIAAHRRNLNIQMVLGEGDIVNDFSSPEQQQSADAAFRVLDNAGIPYLLAIGNHDYDHADPKDGRPVSGFNRFFGPSRYAGRSYYRGNFPTGSNENFFGVLNIGGKDFLFLMLEFMPRAESVAWAESVLQANPDKQVIVVTHSFTYVDRTRVDVCDTDDMPPGNATGDDLWQVLRKYPNVIMVLSGHLTNGQAAHRSDLADNGNLVNEIFANYQTFPHGGDGWLRILTFHPEANTISVQTYSPFLNKFKTDASNQFTVPYRNPHRQTGQGKLSGMVRSASDCSPVAGATVSTSGRSTVTDASGRYSFDLPPGSYQVSVSAAGQSLGPKTETVADGFDTDLNFFLTQPGSAPCALNPESPSVTICSPADDATLASPIRIVAATTDRNRVRTLKAVLDGNGVSTVSGGTLNTTVQAENGRHHLTVEARDSVGEEFEKSLDFTVGDQAPPPQAPDRLSLQVSPAQATIRLGDSAKFLLHLASDGSLTDAVTFSCSGLPAGVRCVFDPAKLKAAALPATVQLTIFTSPLNSAASTGNNRSNALAWAILFSPVFLIVFGRSRQRRIHAGETLATFAFLLCWALIVAGCQGIAAPANHGSFTVTVTSTSGAVQKSNSVQLFLD
jgi:Carboxypeptidase regulatory-like domain/Calcineurin-like phosphoesterase/Bacterial Ig domain